jgi:hypothetical protein
MKYLLLLILTSFVWVGVQNITLSKQALTQSTFTTLINHLHNHTNLPIPRVAESEAYGK